MPSLVLYFSPAAKALTFSPVEIEPGKLVLVLDGAIEEGDATGLREAVFAASARGKVIGLSVNSGGGQMFEAEGMAEFIHESKFPVIVAGDAVCASACFLLFASTPTRIASANAHIGVHSASIDGNETIQTLGATMQMARDAGRYGVPAGVLGRMVTTQPGEMAWLTSAEEADMGVTILPGDGGAGEQNAAAAHAAALAQGGGVQSPPLQLLPGGEQAAPPVRLREPDQTPSEREASLGGSPGAVPTAAGDDLFREGGDDHRAWDLWIGTLSGDYRAGATYWERQVARKLPGACEGVRAMSDTGQFSTGCREATRRLTKLAVSRDTAYASGWHEVVP